MKRSIACIVLFLAIEASHSSFVIEASARSSQPEAMTTGDLATMVCDFEVHSFADDARSDVWRPGYLPECSTEGRRGYALAA
jgi:hypothetical protein